MNRTPRYCASCAEYPFSPDMKVGDSAVCAVRREPQVLTDRACVLYERARDYQQRRGAFIRITESKE